MNVACAMYLYYVERKKIKNLLTVLKINFLLNEKKIISNTGDTDSNKIRMPEKWEIKITEFEINSMFNEKNCSNSFNFWNP